MIESTSDYDGGIEAILWEDATGSEEWPEQADDASDGERDAAQVPLYGSIHADVLPPTAPRLYIIGEDHHRTQPLLKALDACGVPTTVWNTAHGALVVADGVVPPPGVFFCRQSPSAHCRHNGTSIAYCRHVLQWLDAHGAVTINGSRAQAVETSKALQATLLKAAGVNVPRTVLCQGLAQVVLEARAMPGPVILKPNVGGSGVGVRAFSCGRDAAAEIRYAAKGVVEADSADGMWVLQDFVGTFPDSDTAMRTVVRFEVVDGVVQRDYVLKITAPAKEFSLCPCDPRSAAVLAATSFKLLRDPLQIPGFKEAPDPAAAFHAFCVKVEAAFAAAEALVGAVEAIVLCDVCPTDAARFPVPHEPVVIDFNMNTNYSASAEEAAGIEGGASRVARMLQTQWGTYVLRHYGDAVAA